MKEFMVKLQSGNCLDRIQGVLWGSWRNNQMGDVTSKLKLETGLEERQVKRVREASCFQEEATAWTKNGKVKQG